MLPWTLVFRKNAKNPLTCSRKRKVQKNSPRHQSERLVPYWGSSAPGTTRLGESMPWTTILVLLALWGVPCSTALTGQPPNDKIEWLGFLGFLGFMGFLKSYMGEPQYIFFAPPFISYLLLRSGRVRWPNSGAIWRNTDNWRTWLKKSLLRW